MLLFAHLNCGKIIEVSEMPYEGGLNECWIQLKPKHEDEEASIFTIENRRSPGVLISYYKKLSEAQKNLDDLKNKNEGAYYIQGYDIE